jgi:predicted amino acid dehydrogenase
VIVGSFATLQQFAPHDLRKHTLITDDPSAAEIEQARQQGLAALVTMTPPLHPEQPFASPALLEALLLALQPGRRSLSPSSVLQFIAARGWEPTIYHLNPPRSRPVFAFVVHPMAAHHIARKPPLGFTRYLPAPLVEHLAAYAPPLHLSRIRGLQSQATGQAIEGILITLGATPREMLRRSPGFTYTRLVRAAAMAEQMGVRIMGLGAFTSVVGDAGLSVARQTNIGMTTGNALTVAATLETARQAVQAMGGRMEHACIVVMGATGSIGAACARLLAAEAGQLVLVAPRPERLLALQQQITRETPSAHVAVALPLDATLHEADLIITATTALTGDVLNLQTLKPGAVVCDVARPANVRQADAAQRPDILVVESGEIELPGLPNFGFELDLPAGTAYACLAETALLAMEGIFDDYTIGRTIEIERVAHIDSLMQKHGCKLASLRSFGHVLTPEEIAEKRNLATRAAASTQSTSLVSS